MKKGFESPAVTATGDELLKEIWLERRKELWGEGFQLTDIIRNQQSVDRKKFEEVRNGRYYTTAKRKRNKNSKTG